MLESVETNRPGPKEHPSYLQQMHPQSIIPIISNKRKATSHFPHIEMVWSKKVGNLGALLWISQRPILFNSMEGVGGQLFLSALDKIHLAFGCFGSEFLFCGVWTWPSQFSFTDENNQKQRQNGQSYDWILWILPKHWNIGSWRLINGPY